MPNVQNLLANIESACNADHNQSTFNAPAGIVKLGKSGGTIAFFGGTAVTKPAAPTASTVGISMTAPSATVSAINHVSAAGGFGFSTLNQIRQVVRSISNLQVRMAEAENVLSDLGLQA